MFSRRKMTIVFMKQAFQAEHRRFAQTVLSHDVGVSFAVTRSSLLPLFGSVGKLIHSGRYSSLCVPKRVNQRSAKQAISVRLCQRSELTRFHRRHIQIGKQVICESLRASWCLSFWHSGT